jgi:hypothetical protein
MATPTVILIGADKGGVGKTTVARTLLDYFTAEQIPTRAFDTEPPKGALHRFHPKISEIVDVTEISGQMRIFDTVSDLSVTRQVNEGLSQMASFRVQNRSNIAAPGLELVPWRRAPTQADDDLPA